MFNFLDKSIEMKVWKQAAKFRKRFGLKLPKNLTVEAMEIVFHDAVHQISGLSTSDEDEVLVENLEAMLLGASIWDYPELKVFITPELCELTQFCGDIPADGVKPLWISIKPSSLERWAKLAK